VLLDWTQPLDLYCERTDASIWSEPLNALSNGAFLLGALLALRYLCRRARGDRPALALIGLLTAIGIGSFLFHTQANRWSQLADVIPIGVFILVYFFLAMRRFLALPDASATLLTAAFAGLSAAVAALVPPGFLNGSGSYLPAAAALAAIAVLLLRRRHPVARPILAAALLLVLSLSFRSIDQAICGTLPAGAHYLWHLTNAAVLTLLTIAAMQARVDHCRTRPRLAGRRSRRADHRRGGRRT
jgi:hypothetical protein